ncbi:MAG TPA: hypothetical protein VII94_00775 [Candidatus Saccharimonadales bacterium]
MIITTALGIGDLIYLKAALDDIKDQHSEIKIHLALDLIGWSRRNVDYVYFISQLANLLFAGHPYQVVSEGPEFRPMPDIYAEHNLQQSKPNLPILCDGKSLDIGKYIVMTTKNRYITRDDINFPQLWNVVQQLSQKYKVVILGEREVEMNVEYQGNTSRMVYSIYNDIIANVPTERLVDLTIPVLGITSPNMTQLRQDCLIMRDAVSIITFGIGGNFTMANAVGKTVGYRVDQEPCANAIFDSKTYPHNISTRDWGFFLKKLEEL